jgi:hypothetical protein
MAPCDSTGSATRPRPTASITAAISRSPPAHAAVLRAHHDGEPALAGDLCRHAGVVALGETTSCALVGFAVGLVDPAEGMVAKRVEILEAGHWKPNLALATMLCWISFDPP